MDLRSALLEILPDSRVLTAQLDRIAWAGDASFYRMIPQAVVFPESIDEVRRLFALSRERGIPITIRAAGTSLSGQALGEGILLCVTRAWKTCIPIHNGDRVRVGPGVIGERVNQALKPFGRKLGPDPASMEACMMGGILANNSSGMCCGTAHSAYRTLSAMKLLLPNGVLLDSREPDVHDKFKQEAPKLHSAISALREEIGKSPELTEKIRRKYRIKNTMGYALNSFLDFTEPLDILLHLLIGSEGTLGFIAEAEMETVPLAPFRATAMQYYDSLELACRDVAGVAATGAAAIELMDERTLNGIAKAGLLIEYHFESEEYRSGRLEQIEEKLGVKFETDLEEQERLWKIRKGALPRVAANRKPGSSVIIEDVAVPLERLGEAATELRSLLDRSGYGEGAIFGHAKDGNLHFVIAQSFEDERFISKYGQFMEQIADLIVNRFDGSLKAEHGTGRNMAPFVEREWGREAYAIMRKIKDAADPDGLLNPGVLLNEDPLIHLKHTKALPSLGAEAGPECDPCMECGFCEPRCPSRNLSLSPRQRIALRREMVRSPELRRELEREFVYSGSDTCAGDGMCANACPVEIDTGVMIKALRARAHGWLARTLAAFGARFFGWAERALVFTLRLKLNRLTKFRSPWIQPTTGLRLNESAKPESPDYVYFPSCANRVIGGKLPDTVRTVLTRAGKRFWIPPDVRGVCCGMVFQSKGFSEAESISKARMVERVLRWTERGKIPLLVDASPCAWSLKTLLNEALPEVKVLDSVELADEILPALQIKKTTEPVILHPVCSLEKMKLRRAFERVASSCAENACVPASSNCCGFAGDRGFLFPELTRSATSEQTAEILGKNGSKFYSTSTTCEIAMSDAVGKPYQSIWTLLEECSR